MSDSVGWNDPIETADLTIDGVPTDWSGFTRAAKVQRLVDVIQHQILKVRAGTFRPAHGENVAAMALEAQMELAQFYADAESSAKHAKHLVEYAEGETAAGYAKKAAADDIKVTEASLKRMASISDEVKKAKKDLVDLERDYKKWRYVYEILREAHIFFRNIGKL
jgi:hypothetical protein